MVMPEYLIHVCDRDQLYMVCRLTSSLPIAENNPPIYKTVAECSTMEYALMMYRALNSRKNPGL